MSSALGETGVAGCERLSLFGMIIEFRGDSTSLGSMARRKRTRSLASSHFDWFSAVSKSKVAYCRLTDEVSRF